LQLSIGVVSAAVDGFWVMAPPAGGVERFDGGQ